MATEQTTAIVLRCVEFSETSLIVTLFSKDFGRISAIAKGARRPKGPFEGALDLLAVCRVVVIRKQSDALDLLTEAKLHRRFRGGEKSIDRLYAGYAMIELLRILTDDDEPHPEIYDLTIAALGQIDAAGNVAATLLYFKVQLLRMLGHNPGTDLCTDCGGPLSGDADGGDLTSGEQPSMVFSFEAGGLVCDQCKVRQRRNVVVTTGVIDSLRYLSDPKTFPPLSLDSTIYPALRSLVDRYVETVAGRVPRMQPFSPPRLLSTSTDSGS